MCLFLDDTYPLKVGVRSHLSGCSQHPQQCLHAVGIHYMFTEVNRMEIRKVREFPPFLPVSSSPWLLPSKGSGL